MDVLSTLPRDTANTRQLLFTLPLPFSLSRSNYELFWPLVDNVYSIHKTRYVQSQSGDFIRHLVYCRFKRAYKVTPSSSLGLRAVTKRAFTSYKASSRLLEYTSHVEFHVIDNQSSDHDHSLDESNANKRNSALLGLV